MKDGKPLQRGRILKSTRKARPSGSGAWRPPICTTGIAITGGFLRTPQFLNPHVVEQQQFVKINKSEGWLCLAATGKGRQLKPLQRTSVLETLSDIVLSKQATGNEPGRRSSRLRESDPIAALGLDEELPDEALAALSTNRRGRFAALRSKPRTRGGGRKPARNPEVVTICLPPDLVRGEKQQVRMLSSPPKGYRTESAWMHVEDLGWLIGVLAEQVRDGGVDFVPSPSQLRKPYFSERDRSWVCRAKKPDGTLLRKRLAIPLFSSDGSRNGRVPLTRQEYDDWREAKLREITEWQENIEEGVISE